MVKAVIILQSNKYLGDNYTKMTIAGNCNRHFKTFKLTDLLLLPKILFHQLLFRPKIILIKASNTTAPIAAVKI